jgi:hypothetical protein
MKKVIMHPLSKATFRKRIALILFNKYILRFWLLINNHLIERTDYERK